MSKPDLDLEGCAKDWIAADGTYCSLIILFFFLGTAVLLVPVLLWLPYMVLMWVQR